MNNTFVNYEIDTDKSYSSVSVAHDIDIIKHNVISSAVLYGLSFLMFTNEPVLTVSNISIDNSISSVYLTSNTTTKKKEYKAKIKGRSKSSLTDADLSECLNGLPAFDPSKYESYTRDDYEALLELNSSRLAKTITKWL